MSDYDPSHPRFRTTICRHWLEGNCHRGASCNFAHGYEQLRSESVQLITWAPRQHPPVLLTAKTIVDRGLESIPTMHVEPGVVDQKMPGVVNNFSGVVSLDQKMPGNASFDQKMPDEAGDKSIVDDNSFALSFKEEVRDRSSFETLPADTKREFTPSHNMHMSRARLVDSSVHSSASHSSVHSHSSASHPSASHSSVHSSARPWRGSQARYRFSANVRRFSNTKSWRQAQVQ